MTDDPGAGSAGSVERGATRSWLRSARIAWAALAMLPLCVLAFVALVPVLGMTEAQDTWSTWQFFILPVLFFTPLLVAILFGIRAGWMGARRGWAAVGVAVAIGAFGVWAAADSDARCPSTHRDCTQVHLGVAAPSTAKQGDVVTLVVTVRDSGPLNAEAFEIVHTISGATVLSASLEPGSAALGMETDERMLRAFIDALAVDNHATLRVVVQVTAGVGESVTSMVRATTTTPLAWYGDGSHPFGGPKEVATTTAIRVASG